MFSISWRFSYDHFESQKVILEIFGHFCKTEKARIGAISWADIGCVWASLLVFKKLARWHPMQKSYIRFQFHDSIARYRLQNLRDLMILDTVYAGISFRIWRRLSKPILIKMQLHGIIKMNMSLIFYTYADTIMKWDTCH